jgi:hypothetical protein
MHAQSAQLVVFCSIRIPLQQAGDFLSQRNMNYAFRQPLFQIYRLLEGDEVGRGAVGEQTGCLP